MVHRYEKASADQIPELWKANKNPVAVYIHCPFCIGICKYCFYKGTPFSQLAYDKYYQEYLPRLIEMYYPIIEENKIQSWFFGGGTPSLMRVEDMRKLFESLPPKFRTEGEKVYEFHPAFWNEAQLDLLQEYGFRGIIVGVQTFDIETLAGQNRAIYGYPEVHELFKAAKARGLAVAMDLISFLNDNVHDAELMAHDLELAYGLEPDELTISVEYTKSASYLPLAMEEVLKSDFAKTGAYTTEHGLNGLTNPLKPGNLENFRCLRFFRGKRFQEHLEQKYFSFIYALNEGYLSQMPISTLGIGSFRNSRKNTFSSVGEVCYLETNKGTGPEFHVLKPASFFEEARALLDKLEALGEPPKGFTLELKNSNRTRMGTKDLLDVEIDPIRYKVSGHTGDAKGNKLFERVLSETDEYLIRAREALKSPSDTW